MKGAALASSWTLSPTPTVSKHLVKKRQFINAHLLAFQAINMHKAYYSQRICDLAKALLCYANTYFEEPSCPQTLSVLSALCFRSTSHLVTAAS